MNRIVTLSLLMFCLLSVQCSAEKGQNDSNKPLENDTLVTETTIEPQIPAGAKTLLKAYPDFIKGYEEDSLLLADGTRMVYDDGREKSFEQKLDDADPEDMFAFVYDQSAEEPDYLQDAGRSRCEALFKMMYGNSEGAVRQKLISVEWFGERVLFTPVNGAADSLRAVAADIASILILQSCVHI